MTLENVTPAQLLLRFLALEGATTIFGVPGGAVMTLLYELRVRADTFRFVICRQETGAAYMADGYARVSGGLGVVLVTSGPGATNALTGSMNAHASGTPLLTITGEVQEQYFGLGYLQEGADSGLDVNAVYDAAVGFTAMVDSPQNCKTLVQQALRSALDAVRRQPPEPPGPTSPDRDRRRRRVPVLAGQLPRDAARRRSRGRGRQARWTACSRPSAR